MIDQALKFLLNYGHFIAIGLAVAAYAYHWYGIIHIHNNPPWKDNDLRGDRRDVLAGLDEAVRKRKDR